MAEVKTSSRNYRHYTRRVAIVEMWRNCAYSYMAGIATFPVLYAAYEVYCSIG